MKNFNMILSEKQQKYQLYNLEKLINMNILQGKTTQGKEQKILIPRQMLQRLPIALPQVRAGNIPEKLLNQQKKLLRKYMIIY